MGKLRVVLLLGVAVFLVISPVLFASTTVGERSELSADSEPGAQVSETNKDQVGDRRSEAEPEMAAEIESLQFRMDLLHQALAPDTPEEAIQLYAEGLKTRNGALELAAMSPELRKKKEDQYKKMHWITGTSSPWIEQIRMSEGTENPDGTYTYHLQLYWRTSTEPEQPEDWSQIPHEFVVVSEVDGHWYVTDLPGGQGM